MAYGRKVNTDLMRAPRLEAALNEGTAVEFPEHLVARDGVFSARGFLGQNRHFLAVGVGPADPAGNRARWRPRMAVADREIGPLEIVRGELAREPLVRGVALGDDQQA